MNISEKTIVVWGKWPVAFLGIGGFLSIVFFFFQEKNIAVLILCYSLLLFQSRIILWRLLPKSYSPSLLLPFLRAAFYFIPLLYFPFPVLSLELWGIWGGLGVGVAFSLIRFSEIRFNLSPELILLMPPMAKQDKIGRAISLFIAPLSQEFFYRVLIISVLGEVLGIGAVVASILFFVFEHWMHYRSAQTFDQKDYLFQGALSLSLGLVFYFFQSWIGCFLGHLIYNLPGIIQVLKQETVVEGYESN